MNNDELCCARAIVVAKAIADEDPQLKLVKDSHCPLQKNWCKPYMKKRAYLLDPEGPMNFEGVSTMGVSSVFQIAP